MSFLNQSPTTAHKFAYLDGRSRKFRLIATIDELTEGQVTDVANGDADLFEIGPQWKPKNVMTWEKQDEPTD